MITLTNGGVQNASSVAVANGYLVLQLNGDTTVIASPGTVVSAIPVTFRFDSSGNLKGSCKVYSNAELTPQTQYNVTFKDANGNPLARMVWQFDQAAGSTVDIGTMVATSAGVSFSFPFGQTTVTFSATPAFNAASASGFVITLTGNVTSSSVTGAVAGQTITFKILQDATGARTFAWPANFVGAEAISATANAWSLQSFYFDGTNFLGHPMTVSA